MVKKNNFFKKLVAKRKRNLLLQAKSIGCRVVDEKLYFLKCSEKSYIEFGTTVVIGLFMWGFFIIGLLVGTIGALS